LTFRLLLKCCLPMTSLNLHESDSRLTSINKPFQFQLASATRKTKI
jgi:hypothetical protein